MTEQDFIEECRFAKTVIGPNGPAILIAGFVIEIEAPMVMRPFYENDLDMVSAMVKALRRGAGIIAESCEGSTAAKVAE